jgi:hypothetical protein
VPVNRLSQRCKTKRFPFWNFIYKTRMNLDSAVLDDTCTSFDNLQATWFGRAEADEKLEFRVRKETRTNSESNQIPK